MGQAKQRGTYEERKASAIHDRELVISILKKHEEDWWNSLPKEEQDEIIAKKESKLINKSNAS